MNKNDLVQLLATKTDVPAAAAADHLDRVVHDILSRLRRGVAVPLGGLGVLRPGGQSGVVLTPPRSPVVKTRKGER